VPASSANLGPGFDTLAVALECYVSVDVVEAPSLRVRSEGEGAGLFDDASHLAARVVTIERIERLSQSARRLLDTLGASNVEYLVGDGTLGNSERGPYDRVIVTASARVVPEPLYEQLKPDGRIVAPIGDEESQQLVVVEKTATGPRPTPLCACRFVKLIGKAGWATPDG